MAVTPFDIANFNLMNFAQAYRDIFDSTPKTVDIQVMNKQGVITTESIANRGMFKQQIWDDVGGALGQFNRTFYVDADNGDDNNDGSENSPFKTIEKACVSVPIGGIGHIFLKASQTHILNNDIYVYNKRIFFDKWGGNGSDTSTHPIMENIIINGDQTTGFRLYNSVFAAETINFTTAALPSNTTSSIWEGIIKRTDLFTGKVLLYECGIKLQDTDFIRIASGPTNMLDVYLYYPTVTRVGSNRTSYLIYNEYGNISYNRVNGSLKDGSGNNLTDSDLITGIVKDKNGVPRNIISNTIF